MRLVEFLGTPGSGKTTTVARLAEAAAATGTSLERLEPVGRAALASIGRDPVARAVARTAGRYSPTLWKRTMARSSDRVAILCRAIVSRPELASIVIDANQANNLEAGPDTVMGMVLNHLISFQLAEETMADDEWLLLDEGLCNRVISLFAAGDDVGQARSDLNRYLSLIPVPDVLAVMSTPVDVCFDRLEAGGWTSRIAAEPAPRRREFLERSADLVERTRLRMEAAGANVVVVDGVADPRVGVADVLTEVGAVSARPLTVATTA